MNPEQNSQAVELVASQPLGMGQLFQTFFSLLLVILLIIGVAWVLRRSGRFGSALGGAAACHWRTLSGRA